MVNAPSIGITEIGVYIPELRESNYEQAAKFGVDESFIRTKIGVDFVSKKLDGEDTSTMCKKAFANLQNKCDFDVAEVDCIVVVTQNPDGSGLPHTSAIVHGKLGCGDSCAAFDISLGCSGYVYALSVVTSFMLQNDLRCGLLFTADPYSKILNSEDKNTCLLFGDAATVTLLTHTPRVYTRAFAFGTRGKDGDALHCVDKTLYMNGRAVFNFSAVEVPIQIRSLLDKNHLSLQEIDLILLHQGSKSILDVIQRRLQVDDSKVPTNLREQGNTVSSSLPLLLRDCLHNEEVRRIIISGFGVGLSWASGILERT